MTLQDNKLYAKKVRKGERGPKQRESDSLWVGVVSQRESLAKTGLRKGRVQAAGGEGRGSIKKKLAWAILRRQFRPRRYPWTPPEGKTELIPGGKFQALGGMKMGWKKRSGSMKVGEESNVGKTSINYAI